MWLRARYIQEHTNIPIPRVHAYGHARLLRDDPTKQAFMILDYITGRPLTEREFLHSSEEHRRRLYSEIIDVFAQLRGLNFSAAGSLMPRLLSTKPTVVGDISIPANELEVQGYPISLSPSRSTSEFIALQRRLLWDTFSLPTQDLSEADAQLELFALHTMGQITVPHNHQQESFFLTHADLRWPNLIVDDDLQINGIIDWEWAVTVPAEFFLPPSWIITSDDIFKEFQSVLASKQDPLTARLREEWNFCGDGITLRSAQIFRQPLNLLRVFYKFIYPRLFDEPREKAVHNFFNCEQNQKELEKRLRRSERYTQYLKDNDLYVVDLEAQRVSDWVAKAREILGR